jgi:hypothetical protein
MSVFLFALNALALALVIIVLGAIRSEHLRVQHAVAWLGGATLFMAIALPTRVLAYFTRILEIPSPELALMFVLIGSLVLVCFHYGTLISRLRDDNTALAQRLAILEMESRQSGGNA